MNNIRYTIIYIYIVRAELLLSLTYFNGCVHDHGDHDLNGYDHALSDHALSDHVPRDCDHGLNVYDL